MEHVSSLKYRPFLPRFTESPVIEVEALTQEPATITPEVLNAPEDEDDIFSYSIGISRIDRRESAVNLRTTS